MRLCAISVVVAALTANAQVTPARNSCPVMDGRIITAGDLLFISNGEDYVLPHIVPANGKIVLRGIGEIQVLGQTPDQLASLIEERLSKYYKPGSVRIYVVDPKLSR